MRQQTDFEPGQLGFGESSDLGEAGMRHDHVLETFVGYTQGCEEETVDVVRCYGHGPVNHGDAVNVDGGSEVDGRREGAKAVNARQMLDGLDAKTRGIATGRDSPQSKLAGQSCTKTFW